MVRHPLQIGENIVQHGAGGNGADAPLQAPDVPGAQLLCQLIHRLLQRFHLLGGGGVVCGKGGQGCVRRVGYGGEQHTQLAPGRGGQGELFLMQGLGGLLEVQGVVADALEVPDGVEQAGDGAAVLLGDAVLGEGHQIVAEAVLVGVQQRLRLLDLPGPLGRV